MLDHSLNITHIKSEFCHRRMGQWGLPSENANVNIPFVPDLAVQIL
jgi:hypothetical protein